MVLQASVLLFKQLGCDLVPLYVEVDETSQTIIRSIQTEKLSGRDHSGEATL